MKDVTIKPKGQLALLAAAASAVVAAVAVNVPDIKRYLKIRSM